VAKPDEAGKPRPGAVERGVADDDLIDCRMGRRAIDLGLRRRQPPQR
jgi:hypothetical protein